MCLNIKKITGLNTQVHPPVIIQLSSNQTKELTEFMPQYVTTFGSMTFERRLFPSRGGRFEQTQSAACFRLCPYSDDSPPARMKEKYHISNSSLNACLIFLLDIGWGFQCKIFPTLHTPSRHRTIPSATVHSLHGSPNSRLRKLLSIAASQGCRFCTKGS